MLLKAAPSLAEPPVFHNEKDEGKASSFSCCPSSSSAVRKTERKRNRGSFVLVEKEFGMRVTVLIVLIALVRADALGEDLMDDHGGDAAGNNGGIKEYLEETRQAFKNFRGSHGHEAHPDGHGNDDGFTSVHFMLQQDADTRTGDGPKKDDQRAPEHGAGQKLEKHDDDGEQGEQDKQRAAADAQSALQDEARRYDAAKLKYELGTIARIDFEKAQLDYETKASAVQSAYGDIFTAALQYDWLIRGLPAQ